MNIRTASLAPGWLLPLLVCVVAAAPAGESAVPPAAAPAAWPFPVGAAQRPGTYFWCPGSALTREGVDWNLERLREAGFGFVHLVPIYGARGAEEHYLPYLSARWMEMLDYTVRQAQARGLFVDMTTGTGWCFGGPDLPADAIDVRARYEPKSGQVTLVPGMKVKRAAPGGEGAMLDPFSPRAMDLYLARFSQAFDQFKPAAPRAQYHDSFEYRGDWSVELPAAFQARRGYDLREHLDVFFGAKPPAAPEQLARLKYDYRLTLAELHREAIQRWVDWAHRRGMLTRDQAHGSPANLLDVYATADIPETEMFGAPEFPIPGFRRDPEMVRAGDSDPRICLLAASAAHVAHSPGRQLVTSESGTWLREHWHGTLAQLKLELDLFFLAGVNQMLFHGTCYSPPEATWPGWFFYASTQMNWRNSIWRDVRFLADYIGRCQSVLQAGQPANDVLLYWPIHDLWMNPAGTTLPLTVHRHDWMAKERIGEVADALLARGFAFDFISDRMIADLRVENGRLVAPGGSYRALVVPACKYLPAATAERLADLGAQGVPIVFEQAIPSDVPGLTELEKSRAQLAVARARLPRSGASVSRDAVTGLEQAGVPRETMADAGLRCIRRKAGDAHWYFIANHTARDFDGWLTLAVPFAAATRFDPLTGRSGRLVSRAAGAARQVYLQLAAGESLVVQAVAQETAGPAWPVWRPAAPGQPLNGEWSVEFIEGGPELPAGYRTTKLETWTRAPDPRAQALAGAARYTLRFAAPPQTADDWWLDLGDVRDSARVRLNGRDVGALIAIPFRVRVGEFLRAGENTLEVEVTNVSANRIRDLERRGADWRVMKDVNIVSVAYQKFEPSKWPLEDSGLLGPVKLVPLRKLALP